MRSALLFLAACAAWAAPLHAEWRRATSRHFILYSQGPASEIQKSVVALERYDQLLRLMSISKPDEDSAPLTVFLVANAAQVGDLIGQSNAAGFYTVGPQGPIAVGPRIASYDASNDDFSPQVVLFHEYAHHYMLQNYTAAYPGWFVEGYAELLGATGFASDGSANVGQAATYRFAGLHTSNPIPIRALLADDPDNRKRDVFAFYSEAWLLTHYLVFNDKRSPQLRRYLGLVSGGTKPIDAATQAFGDLSKLVGEYEAYRNAPSIPGLHITQQNAPAIENIRVETLDAAGQALVWDRLLYMRGLRPGEPAKIAADLMKRAVAAPRDPATLDLLWRVQLAADDTDAAERTADALLAIKPSDPSALLGKGLIAMKKLEDAKDFAVAKWVSARQLLVDANKGDASSPEILFAYYQSFVRAHQTPSANARLALMRAFELQPQASWLRLTLAGSLIDERRYTEARVALKPAAFSVHDPGSAAVAQKMLATIDTLKDGDAPPMTLPEIDRIGDGARKN
ncbi:hypothetical protein [Sphingomonas crusticola]|uniref:hypothetical protein n=1 Tax=Sphingomonas crusticola TaxID=1697973 RepID=UPI000E23E900|nr:hypothetical protein [Sphingomonas crusticola]